MRKFIIGGIAAAALALGVAGAGTASATTAYYPSGTKGDQSAVGYYNDVVAEGIPGSVSQASGLGGAVCEQLRAGASEDALISTVMETPGYNTTRNQAKVTVWSAEWHFCPSYY